MKRGVTLVETLVVITIIAVLASILYPVLASARASANEAKCVSNLRQIGMALSLYQISWAEETSLYGAPDQMGLPPWFPMLAHAKLIDQRILTCHGIDKRAGVPVYTQLWPPPGLLSPAGMEEALIEWNTYLAGQQSQATLIYDGNHSYNPSFSPFATQKALGLRIDGSVRKRHGKGEMGSLKWWQ